MSHGSSLNLSMFEPTIPRSAWRVASSTIRRLSVSLKAIQSSTAISSPPANSAARTCQPRRMRRTTPSSKTRLVEANPKMIVQPFGRRMPGVYHRWGARRAGR